MWRAEILMEEVIEKDIKLFKAEIDALQYLVSQALEVDDKLSEIVVLGTLIRERKFSIKGWPEYTYLIKKVGSVL